MSRIYVPVILFVLLILEGTVFQLVAPTTLAITLVPRFLIVMMVFIGIHLGRYSGIVYGMTFGIIYDIVYTQLLGVYMFGLAFIGYFFALTFKRVQDSILIQLLIIFSAIAFFEIYQYGLFRLIGMSHLTFQSFLEERLVPSLILNIAFAILVYYPVKRLLEYVQKQITIRAR